MRHFAIARTHQSTLVARLVITLQVALLASVGFGVTSVASPVAAVAEDGPCGANPCGPVPADQGPCGANPCGPVPADQGPCGANPCAKDVPADPNAPQPATTKPATKASPTTAAPKAPDSTPTTTIDTTGSRRDKAASVVNLSKSEDGGFPVWVVPLAFVVVIGLLVVWLVRRRRVHDEPSI